MATTLKGEVELLSLRATLFLFDAAVVRGGSMGDARLVKHGITGKAVFEVSQENTLQRMCNFFLVPDRELRQCKGLGMVGLWSLLGKSTREHPPRARVHGACLEVQRRV